MYRLGFDVGGTKINVGVIDGENKLVAAKKLEVKNLTSPVEDISSAVKELCCANGIDPKKILSLGIGVPGTVSSDGKRLIKAPNIAILSDDFLTRLEKALGIPALMIQDSRAAALGEYLAGGGRGASTLICITLGTGIGTGLVIGGNVYHGALGAAGELGHIPVKEGGRPCGCGKLGCLEKYAAGRGLDITASELYGEGATAHDLFTRAKEGDANALCEISKAKDMLGNALVSAVNLLSPDCILFSGGLAEQTELFLYPLIEYIKSHCYSIGELPRIEKAYLGEYSPLIGAALYGAKIENR